MRTIIGAGAVQFGRNNDILADVEVAGLYNVTGQTTLESRPPTSGNPSRT